MSLMELFENNQIRVTLPDDGEYKLYGMVSKYEKQPDTRTRYQKAYYWLMHWFEMQFYDLSMWFFDRQRGYEPPEDVCVGFDHYEIECEDE